METYKVVTRRITDVADGIRAFDFVMADGSPLRPFEAGSHIILHPPNGTCRRYSLLNGPGETDAYRIAVLREDQGRGGSRYLHRHLKEGTPLHILGPFNHFPVDDCAENYLLLAGGIGITPILSIARHLHAAGKPFALHYCARSHERAAFADWLAACPFAAQATFHFSGGDPAKRLDIASLARAQHQSTQVYFCGPQPFMVAVEEACADWPSSRVHSESFLGAGAVPKNAAPFDVQIAGTGEIITVPADRTLLDALWQAGHSVDFVCREGICGSCMVDLVSGDADHRDDFLTDEEKRRNDLLMACCSRAKSGRLVIDP